MDLDPGQGHPCVGAYGLLLHLQLVCGRPVRVPLLPDSHKPNDLREFQVSAGWLSEQSQACACLMRSC
jgi:hypothetical protein